MNRSVVAVSSIVFSATISLIVAASALAADETVPRTGSRTGSDATSRTIIPLGRASEIERVRELLQAGETEAAITLAEDYLQSLDSAVYVGIDTAQQRYDALNALCAAMIKAGRLDAAIDRCTQAIELRPSLWSAVNNRGTAQFAQHEYQRALEDYQRARELANNADEVAAAEHNIALAEARLRTRSD